jgi:folate-binding protein YgfZ
VNVPALVATGGHKWGALLNPKGRVLSVFSLSAVVGADELTLRCEPTLVEKTMALLTRYAVMDDVNFTVSYQPLHQRWESLQDPWLAPFVTGAVPAAALPLTDVTVEAARIRAGLVRYGADINEDCFPFETPLTQWLDYEKGCYVGQEPVFRVHSQGNAARALRIFRVKGNAPLPVGTTVSHASRPNAGQITSSAAVDDETIALAFIHRTVLDQTEFLAADRVATLQP